MVAGYMALADLKDALPLGYAMSATDSGAVLLMPPLDHAMREGHIKHHFYNENVAALLEIVTRENPFRDDTKWDLVSHLYNTWTFENQPSRQFAKKDYVERKVKELIKRFTSEKKTSEESGGRGKTEEDADEEGSGELKNKLLAIYTQSLTTKKRRRHVDDQRRTAHRGSPTAGFKYPPGNPAAFDRRDQESHLYALSSSNHPPHTTPTSRLHPQPWPSPTPNQNPHSDTNHHQAASPSNPNHQADTSSSSTLSSVTHSNPAYEGKPTSGFDKTEGPKGQGRAVLQDPLPVTIPDSTTSQLLTQPGHLELRKAYNDQRMEALHLHQRAQQRVQQQQQQPYQQHQPQHHHQQPEPVQTKHLGRSTPCDTTHRSQLANSTAAQYQALLVDMNREYRKTLQESYQVLCHSLTESQKNANQALVQMMRGEVGTPDIPDR